MNPAAARPPFSRIVASSEEARPAPDPPRARPHPARNLSQTSP